jgi:hypothetical protein
MSVNLTIQAGRKAYDLIKAGGLDPSMVKVIAGAAGGPKWLILSAFDRLVFPAWFKQRTTPLHLVGSSIGAWRFAALCQPKPAAAIERFLEAYLDQRYSDKPSAIEVSEKTRQIQDQYISNDHIDAIINHPTFRLNILAVRCRWPNSSDNRLLLGLGLTQAFLLNLIRRRWLELVFERTVFHHPESINPGFSDNPFKYRSVVLNRNNLKPALLASGSIPLVMSGVQIRNQERIAVYRDGGLTDYHLDIPFLPPDDDGIVFYPHYLNRIIPGWFDKQLKWRKPDLKHLEHVLLVSPSQRFVDRLPYQKIPDRNDFWTFQGKERERLAYWQKVVTAGEVLALDWLDCVDSGRVRSEIRPFV